MPEETYSVRAVGFVLELSARTTLMTPPLRRLPFDVDRLDAWDLSLSDLEFL